MYKNRHQITGARVSAIPELKELISPLMLRRKKDEVLTDLPPIHYQQVLVDPGLVDIEVESSMVHYVFPIDRRKELAAKLRNEEMILRSTFGNESLMKNKNILALEALSQSVSTLRRYNGLQKVEPVADMIIEELTNKAYEKIVVFAIHRDCIEGLRQKLRKFKPVTLYGGTPPENRQKHIDSFQKDPKCRVFIGNIQAAGTAITLTAAHQVLFLEQSWVPGDNAQAAMRCHRIGQKKPVTVRFVGIANTIDEKISTVLQRKAYELTRIFDEARDQVREAQQNPLPSPSHN
jgi:SWI/SNF-related matrix-associated actin-dependent regulator 1 of chromatin subfamily A